MAFWQTILRLGRSELTTFVFATFLAFAIAPGAMAVDATLLPTEAHAVLFWLQSAETGSVASAEAPFAPPTVRARRKAAPHTLPLEYRPQLRHIALEAPVVAYLSGIRTNRILN